MKGSRECLAAKESGIQLYYHPKARILYTQCTQSIYGAGRQTVFNVRQGHITSGSPLSNPGSSRLLVSVRRGLNSCPPVQELCALTLSHMAYEVLFTIWQGGQLAIPLKTTLGKVKTILGAVSTLAMLCSIMYAPCCQTLHSPAQYGVASCN